MNILGGQHWRNFFMACSKLVTMAIYVVKQAWCNEIMLAVYGLPQEAMVQLHSWMIPTEACLGTFVALKGACRKTTTATLGISENWYVFETNFTVPALVKKTSLKAFLSFSISHVCFRNINFDCWLISIEKLIILTWMIIYMIIEYVIFQFGFKFGFEPPWSVFSVS